MLAHQTNKQTNEGDTQREYHTHWDTWKAKKSSKTKFSSATKISLMFFLPSWYAIFPFCLAFISLRAKICLILLRFSSVGKNFAACFSSSFFLASTFGLFYVADRNILYNMCVCECALASVCMFVCGKPSSAQKCARAIERQHHNKEGQISECVDSKRLSLCIFLTLTVFLLRFFAVVVLLGTFAYTLHNMHATHTLDTLWMRNDFAARCLLFCWCFFCCVVVFAIQSKLFCNFYKFEMRTMRI